MKITSNNFENEGVIPSKYTCDGEDLIPYLEIDDIPENAKSLVLIMDDPDIPDFVRKSKGIEVFDHWIVFNMEPQDRNEDGLGRLVIEEGVEPEGVKGVNSAGKIGYMGPCPPDKEHRYFFKIFALSSTLELPEGVTSTQVEKAMDGLVLEKAELVASYERVS